MGTTPRTALPYAAAVLAALILPGCSNSAPNNAPSSSADAPGPSSPAQICTALVSYWAKESLKGSKWSGLDWEQKGLSNDQYAIHEEAVAAGRAEERTHGQAKGLELIDRLVAQRCTEQDGATRSSENWRPPQ